MLARTTTALLAATARSRTCGPIKSAVTISSSFDAGNIDHIQSEDPSLVRLKIKPDPFTELEAKKHMQWFAFRATHSDSDAAGEVTYEIDNAGQCSFATAWKGAEVMASMDKVKWIRVPSTRYDEATGKLTWNWTHDRGSSVYFAYFDLYSYEQHLALVAKCAAAASVPGLRVHSLGQTLDGRELDCVSVGTGSKVAWVIHRQHPGESMAEFFAEGLLTRLLGLSSGGEVDPLAMRLLKEFTFHIVPSMNPDGALRGHLRVNACGANLNREWASTGDYVAPTLDRSPEVRSGLALPCTCTCCRLPRHCTRLWRRSLPSLSRSPQVYHVLQAMDATGVDAFVDVHGDEALPFAFVAGGEGLPVWGARLQSLQGAFVAAYARANPDMQAKFGYTPDAPLEGNLAICSNQVAQRFDCLGVTLEMPFKDSAAVPRSDPNGSGFDGRRASMLGHSLLDALAHVASQLRDTDQPVFPLPDDQYVAPIEDEEAIAQWVAERRARA